MRAIGKSFHQMIKCLLRDVMLLAVCVAPILMGLFFRLAIPAGERVLTAYLKKGAIIAPYYELFDVFFSVITPTLFCYVAAMVVLEERDEGTAKYLCITPLRRKGYISSRFGIPCLIAMAVTICLLPIFRLTRLPFGVMSYLAVAGGLQGLIVALCIITFSSNKLEGMAVTKLSSLLAVALMVPYFVTSRVQYVLCMLPSLWIGKAVKERNLWYGVLSFVLLGIWTGVLFHRYVRQSSQRNQ